jgi:F0F1-type ATP synthase assembly protein I
MIIIIVCGTFGGLYLDNYLNVKPLFTVLLSLLSVVFAIYLGIKDFLKKGNNK